ncbi:MAG: hypothetical protein IPJ21_10430 [Sterolibacteriaceae bacterium]|nr:hypothetical protein [Sterolibacteriaceae bacterium]MBK9084276.1 hypothetical protein [Sterolibacteriaceae bacterium]
MLRQRLTLLLLAFLALLQGLTPLLHAHAGESSAGIPHFHVSVGTASTPAIAVNGTRLQLQAAGDAVVDAVNGHSRHESLRLVDAPTEQIARVDRVALTSGTALPRAGATVPKLPAIGFSRPPARASPILA